MGEQRKDGVFRIAGIVGLAALLLLTLWMRSSHRDKTRGRNTDHISTKDTLTRNHPDLPPHERESSDDMGSGHAKILLPSGRLTDGIREVPYEAYQYGFDPDPLIVRSGEKVRLLVKSRDVEHGMMIPELDFNAPMPTEEAKAVEFIAPAKPGEYPIFCSVFCGADHGAMKGTLIVLPVNGSSSSANPDLGGRHE